MTPHAATKLGGSRNRAGAALRVVAWIAIKIYPFAFVLLVWHELAVRELIGNQFVLPPPAAVWDSAVDAAGSGVLLPEVTTTLRRVGIAYLLALVVGIGCGALVGRIDVIRRAVRPLVAFAFPIPKIAIYPAMVIIFGLGSPSKIALGFTEAVFLVLLATAAGTSQVEPRLLWCGRSLGTSERGLFWKVVLPAALPSILTGARIGLVGAIMSVFVGEMIVGSDGLGSMMAVGWRLLDTGDMYLAVITISLIGFCLDRLFLRLRSSLLRWAPEGGTR